MNTLHLIFNQVGLKSCARLKASGDQVILIGDGVYHFQSDLAGFDQERLFTLEDDYLARGLPPNKALNLISYAQMVDLCTKCAPIVSWHA